jgi:hypothetical protein
MFSIVAIHGLNPFNKKEHSLQTWQHPNGNLWLRDSLPAKLPRARILIYSYNSNPVIGADKERFIHMADNALKLLRLRRLEVSG